MNGAMLKASLCRGACICALILAGCSAQSEPSPQTPTAPAASTPAETQAKAAENLPSNPALNPAARQAIATLRARADVQAAAEQIKAMNATNIARLIEITEIPAPPFAEDARAKDLVARFKSVGLTDVSLDAVGNVLARRKGSDGTRTVAMIAHIDTVFPAETDVTVRREGDVFYAPGIGDNSQGLVAMLAIAQVLETHGITTRDDILFVGSVGEEGLGDLRGVRHLFGPDGTKIDSVIAVDGGSDARIITQAVGSSRYRVTFEGPGGHSYGAFGRAHPHQALADAITRFKLAATPITQAAAQDGIPATFSVGRIGGGTSINSIPFTSWMEVDMRSIDPDTLSKLDAVFQTAMQEALSAENARRTRDDPLTIDVKSVGQRPAGQTDPNASVVTHAAAAVRAMGLEPEFRASSTDANIPMSLGIPAVTMSRGGISRNAHAPNESWENKDAHIAVQALLLTTLAEAGG